MRFGLRGFVGQTMSGRKDYSGAVPIIYDVAELAAGSGTITAPRDCWCTAMLIGGGGSGANNSGGGESGGGGGGAVYGRFRVFAGEVLSYTIGVGGAAVPPTSAGNPGTDSTLTTPTGIVLIAGGGRGGVVGNDAAGGPGGVASGGRYNWSGGTGGACVGGVGQAGQPGENGGGAGGAGVSDSGGGGGAANPAHASDLIVITPGAGGANPAAQGALYGGGGAGPAGGSTQAGADGRGYVIFSGSE